MSDDLKPCPFCGASAKHYHRPDDSGWSNTDWVCCSGDRLLHCGASTCLHETKEQAVAAWNNRVGTFTHAQIEAAVKRALEGAAQEAAQTYLKSPDLYELGVAASDNIRALDPAQFVDGER